MSVEALQPVARWPHQIQGVRDVLQCAQEGHRIIVLTSPTGGGKTTCICDLIEAQISDWKKVVLYTNRKMLIEQTVKVMEKSGIRHGVRASGWDPNLHYDVQVSSVQTEASRVLKRKSWDLHQSDFVIVDELHLQKGATCEELYRQHLEHGATIVGVTATPIDCGTICETRTKLVVAGTTSELRACGALVPAYHYGPDEPDVKHLKRVKIGEDLSENQIRKAIMTSTIWSRVLDNYRKLNPDQRPTLLFAPGVAESLWFAEQFQSQGINAAHIDGEDCWIKGKLFKSDQHARDDILAGSESGDIKVVANRFVLREAIDMKWLEFGIMATIFGSLQSYLQSGGRLLRASPATGKTCAIIQDHGGAWHSHGSLNMDRDWEQDYTMTAAMVSGLREEKFRQKEVREPIRCPKCAMIRASGNVCPKCGFEVTKKSRPVVQLDGTIREMTGDIFKPRFTRMNANTFDLWKKMYYRAKKSRTKMTFNQARGLFQHTHHYAPPNDLPLMPKDAADWFRRVCEVPANKLHDLAPEPSMFE